MQSAKNGLQCIMNENAVLCGERLEAQKMTKKKHTLGRFRLVYRRSPALLKLAVLVLLVLSIVTLLALRIALLQTDAQYDQLRQHAAQLEQENQQLEQNIAELGTVQSVKRIAMEELGLVDPDTTFFQPVDSTDPE